MNRCINCGSAMPSGSPTCAVCGMVMGAAGVHKPAHSPPNDFTRKFHSYGGSGLYLFGILLFTAGSLLGIFISFELLSIISLLLYTLPIVGFWLIFAASKSPSYPEKGLTAITLFKISVIIGLIGVILLLILLIIGFVWVINTFGMEFISLMFDEVPVITSIIIGVLIAIILFIILYFKSVLTVLSGLRNGLQGKHHGKVRNVGLFTFLMSLIVGFAVLSSVITLVFVDFAQQMMSTIFDDFFGFGEFSDIFGFFGFYPLGFVEDILQGVMLSAIFSLVENLGIILCLIALCGFNNSLASGPMHAPSAPAPLGQPQMPGRIPSSYGQPPSSGYGPPPMPYPPNQPPIPSMPGGAPAQSPAKNSCSSCGFPTNPIDIFCENCGQRQAAVAPPPSQVAPPPPPPPPRPAAPPPPPPPAQPISRQPAVIPPMGPPPAPPPAAAPQSHVQPAAAPVLNTPRMSLIFLLDTSVHAKPYIGDLNSVINNFKSAVIKDPRTENMLDISVIVFNDEVAEKQKLAPVSRMRPMRLIAGGESKFSPPILEAMNMLPPASSSASYKPWVVLISAADPSDDITLVTSSVKSIQNADKLRIIALSVGGSNIDSLKSLTDVVFKQDGTDFATFFDWVAKSMWAISKTSPGEKPTLPQMEGKVSRV